MQIKGVNDLAQALRLEAFKHIVLRALSSEEESDSYGFKSVLEMLDDVVYDALEARCSGISEEKLF